VEGLFFGFAVELSDKVSAKSGKMRKELNLLKAAIKELDLKATSAGKGGKAFGGITKGAKGAGTAIMRGKKKAGRFATAMKGLASRLRKTSTSFSFMQKVVLGLGAAFTAASIARAVRAIGRAFVGVVKTGAEFGRSMKFAGAVARASAGQLVQLRDEAKRIGATTAFTATQAAEGFVVLGQAGKTTAQSLAILKNAVDLAGASQVDLKKATQATLDAMAVFQIPAEKAKDTVDTLARSATSAFQTLGDLSNALKKAGPTAKAAGRTLEETAAAIGVFANAGVRGGEGGTALRNVLAKIQIPSKNLDRALNALGLRMSDLNPKTNDLNTIFNRLQPILSRADLSFKLFGLRTTPAFTAAMLSGTDAVKLMTEKMRDGKTAAELYIAQMDSVSGALKIVASAAEAVQIELFDIIKEQLKKDLTVFSSLMQRASIAVSNLKEPIRIVFTTFTNAFGLIFKRSEQLTEGLEKSFKTLAKTGVDSRKAIRDVVGPLTIALIIIKVKILEFVNGFIDGLGEAFDFFQGVFELLSPILKPLLNFFADLLGFTDEGKSKAEQFGKAFGVIFGLFIGFIALKAALIIPLFVFDSFKKFLLVGVQVLAGVGSKVIWLRGLLVGDAASLTVAQTRVRGGFTKIKTVGKRAFSALGTAATTAFGAMGTAAKFFLKTILPAIATALAIAAAFGIAAVIVSNIFKVWGDDSLSFMDKVQFVGEESLKTILGFVLSFFGVAKEKVDLFVDVLAAKMGEGLATAFVFWKQLGENISLWISQQLQSFGAFASGIGRFFESLVKGIVAAFSAISLKTLIFGSDQEREAELKKATTAFKNINQGRRDVNTTIDKDLEKRQEKEKAALQRKQLRELNALEEASRVTDAALQKKADKAFELGKINEDIANREKKASDDKAKDEEKKDQKRKARKATDLDAFTQREGESTEDFIKRIQDIDITDIILGRPVPARTTEELGSLGRFGDLSSKERVQAADQLQAAIATTLAQKGAPTDIGFLKEIFKRSEFETAGPKEQAEILKKLQSTLGSLQRAGPTGVRRDLIRKELQPVTAQLVEAGKNLAGTSFKEFKRQDLQEEFRKREAFINKRRKAQGLEALKTDLSQIEKRVQLERFTDILGVEANKIRTAEAKKESNRREELNKRVSVAMLVGGTKLENERRKIEGRKSLEEEQALVKRKKIQVLDQQIAGERLANELGQASNFQRLVAQRKSIAKEEEVLIATVENRRKSEQVAFAKAKLPEETPRRRRRRTRAVSIARKPRGRDKIEAADLAKAAVGAKTGPEAELEIKDLSTIGEKFTPRLPQGRDVTATQPTNRQGGRPTASTFIFNEGSVVIQVASGDPREIAKTFLPHLKDLEAEEERRGA